MNNQKCKMMHIKGNVFAPKLCNCGGYEILANGKNVGSFFWDSKIGEFVCSTCGICLNRYGEYIYESTI
jgi:hypothetical protein